jgi:hypothetical protein
MNKIGTPYGKKKVPFWIYLSQNSEFSPAMPLLWI